ncbi:MAG TPA: hypothetical protein VIJ22_17680 [Polyangiaceae bacterium]
MKLVAEGDKIILRREDVFARKWEALTKIGLVMPDKKPNKTGVPDADLTVFGRIVSIGPEYKGTTLSLGMLVVFGTAAQIKFRDGSEFVITTPGGILARVVDSDADNDTGAALTGGDNGTAETAGTAGSTTEGEAETVDEGAPPS